MRLSVICATRNRAHAILPCLDSIAAAFAAASPVEAEIIIVDNGSTDASRDIIAAWIGAAGIPATLLVEPAQGRARCFNRALRATRGDIIATLDDDCRMHRDHVNDLLRYNAADTAPVLRGGKVELGDPTDLPYTIYAEPEPMRWQKSKRSLRHSWFAGRLFGCNLTAPWTLFETVGPFDENFGPGSAVGSGDDIDYMLRAYGAGYLLEYVPAMAVAHHHGRKTSAEINALYRRYFIGAGGLNLKYLAREPDYRRSAYWPIKTAPKEIIRRRNLACPEIDFSACDMTRNILRGALRYALARKGPIGTLERTGAASGG